MSHAPTPSDASPAVESAGSWRQRAAGLLRWAIATRLRMALTGALSLVALGGMFASWSYMAHLAVDKPNPLRIETALEALDEGRLDDAQALITAMHDLPPEPEILSGAMYVMGVVKVREAEQEPSVDRQQAVFQVAARYLIKAQELGLDEQRSGRAVFLAGKSLVGGGEASAGVALLEQALADPRQPQPEIKLLIARALLESPHPDLQKALEFNGQVLAEESLAAQDRQRAWLDRAEILLGLERAEEARASLEHVEPAGRHAADRALLQGRVTLQEVLSSTAEASQREASQREARIHAALTLFREAKQLDQGAGPATRQATYWSARCYELRGEVEEALAEYGRLGKVFADAPEGIAAALAVAEHELGAGQVDRALTRYRDVLAAIGDPQSYRNPLLSLDELRRRLNAAHQRLAADGHFSQAIELVAVAEPVLGRAVSVEVQGKTQQQWGTRLLEQSTAEDRWTSSATLVEARSHFREAGFAFEKLARLRAASRMFSDDLWVAADCFFQGHSYTNVARLLEEYLYHEAKSRNAMALLRLGQCRLAGNHYKEAIAAFEECVELFPGESVAFQARLECARAYQQQGNYTVAESLLLSNLDSDALTPRSLEWRDSKFALGRLLYDSERYDESIACLREAVERYPTAEATLLARYTMARAYHNASTAPSARMKEAKTDDERQKNREASESYLDLAYNAYLEVQRAITDRGHTEANPLESALLRHCYMMQGSVLFELKRYAEARQAYGSVITLYQNDPIVLECYVQAANCWRRLAQPVKARVMLDQARMVLDRLPKETNFMDSTNFNREQWESLLSQMGKW